ncbi:MAG: right-handed parallel beta-helix repeat-containing protein [Candidatus Omnitrophica bacterium]|nr:right-handed parallel beta-helix repeat-containing protein [Candidatus Omnitrophota bacterium]
MRRKKAFTILEVLIATLIFSVIGMAAGSLYQLHAKLIKESSTQFQSILDAQLALAHINENIANSAWIVVESPTKIELHSHSYPRIRTYTLSGGKLIFQEGERKSAILARDIETKELFKGVDEERLTKRFRSIEMELWNEPRQAKAGGSTYGKKGLFYAKVTATSKESWDLIYVDPRAVSGAPDGTKQFPYLDLTTALGSVTESSDTPETIFVVTGDHSFSGSAAEVRNMFVCFSDNTSLAIHPGTRLYLGTSTMIYTEGDFQCGGEDSGSSAKVLVYWLRPERLKWRPGDNYWDYYKRWRSTIRLWGGIIVNSKQVNINILNTNFYQSGGGVRIFLPNYTGQRRARNERKVEIAGCTVSSCRNGLFVYGADDLRVHDNYFYGKSSGIYTFYAYIYQYNNPQTTQIKINDNAFYYYPTYHVVYLRLFARGAEINSDIYNNLFYYNRRSVWNLLVDEDSYYGSADIVTTIHDNWFHYTNRGIHINHYGYGGGRITDEIYNNRFERINDRGIQIYSRGGTDTSNILIHNNIIENAYSGIYLDNSMAPVDIYHNKIMAGTRGIFATHTNKGIIRNNFFHDNTTGVWFNGGGHSTYTYRPFKLVFNPILKEDQQRFTGEKFVYQYDYPGEIRVLNNIFYNNTGNGIIATRSSTDKFAALDKKVGWRDHFAERQREWEYNVGDAAIRSNTLVNSGVEGSLGSGSRATLESNIVWGTGSHVDGIPDDNISDSDLYGTTPEGSNISKPPPFDTWDNGPFDEQDFRLLLDPILDNTDWLIGYDQDSDIPDEVSSEQAKKAQMGAYGGEYGDAWVGEEDMGAQGPIGVYDSYRGWWDYGRRGIEWLEWNKWNEEQKEWSRQLNELYQKRWEWYKEGKYTEWYEEYRKWYDRYREWYDRFREWQRSVLQ